MTEKESLKQKLKKMITDGISNLYEVDIILTELEELSFDEGFDNHETLVTVQLINNMKLKIDDEKDFLVKLHSLVFDKTNSLSLYTSIS